MGPRASLDEDALRANVRAFAALGAPVVAVVKADGYGWGARRLARALDGVVAGYVVNDVEEYDALRGATALPIRTLADVPPERVAGLIAGGGIPNVSTLEALAAVDAAARARGGAARIRVGVTDAAGWAAPSEAIWPAFVAAAARATVAIELWTHLSSSARSGALLTRLAAARETLTAAGANVVSVDVASTAVAAPAYAADRLRIGAGLFGARLGAPVPTRCAIRLEAPVVRRYAAGEIGWAGYGDVAVPAGRAIEVVRCGYGDGFPKMLAGRDDILAVGMQYTTCLAGTAGSGNRVLIGPATDLDELARQAGIAPHELVVGTAAGDDSPALRRDDRP